ncbi:MAG: hypothetical protein V1904_06965, partial [Bacteroidota bacterium]
VCGEDSHIRTLNFSIHCLKKFSKNQILVVTDKTRNTKEIEHDNIIDIPTQKDFSSHQASIFLKTSLHKIVEPGNFYCYLDSDVIALNKDVDKIFSFKSGQVTFASDHTTIDRFSPYATNCWCLDKHKQLQNLLEKHNPFAQTANISNPSTRKLFCFLDEIKKTRFSRLLFDLRFHSNKIIRKKFHAGNGFYYVFKTKTWEDKENHVLLHDMINYKDKIEAESNFRFTSSGQKWIDENNNIINDFKCNHLIRSIKEKFGIKIEDKTWLHWNGGVFIFDNDSHEFMESWHNKTMSIFNDPLWKVRDQGTLAATAWEFGLQNNQRIPEEFNFIADYYNPFISFNNSKGFTKDNFKTVINPKFIHIYHNFGNKKWDIWQGVESIHKLSEVK